MNKNIIKQWILNYYLLFFGLIIAIDYIIGNAYYNGYLDSFPPLDGDFFPLEFHQVLYRGVIAIIYLFGMGTPYFLALISVFIFTDLIYYKLFVSKKSNAIIKMKMFFYKTNLIKLKGDNSLSRKALFDNLFPMVIICLLVYFVLILLGVMSERLGVHKAEEAKNRWNQIIQNHGYVIKNNKKIFAKDYADFVIEDTKGTHLEEGFIIEKNDNNIAFYTTSGIHIYPVLKTEINSYQKTFLN